METLAEYWSTVLDWLGPNRWLQAGIIIVLAMIAAKLVDWVIVRVFKSWAGRTDSDVDDQVIDLVHRPIFLTVLFIGLSLATGRLELQERVTWFTNASLKTICALIWMGFLIRASKLVLGIVSRHHEKFAFVQPRTLPLFDNLAVIVIVAVGSYVLLMAWDLDPTGWLASAGIVGLALSFAAKDSLANLFAGVFIFADSPYKVDDYIILDSGERGMVTHIGIRSTRLLTRDDVEVTIPNAVMGNAKIVNESGGPHEKERVRLRVGVAYGSDIDLVEAVLMRIALSHVEICTDPEPRVRFRAFGGSSLDFELLGWIEKPELRGRLLHELHRDVYKQFAAEGIEIPYSKHDLYIKEMPSP